MIRDRQALIPQVAHEEMAHPGIDTNLLAAGPHTPHCRRPNLPLLRRYFRTDEPLDVGGTRFMKFTLTSFPSPGAAHIRDQLACRVPELFNDFCSSMLLPAACSTAWS